MEHDSRNNTESNTFSDGAGPSWMDRLEYVVIPQHSTFQGANPLDLPSAIARELQRSHSTSFDWQYPSPQDPATVSLQQQEPVISQNGNLNIGRALLLPPYYIPRFEEVLEPETTRHHQQTGLQQEYSSSHQGLFSGSNGFSSQLLPGQVHSSMRSAACSPWIERMMQADVTPTPCPSFGISTSLSLTPQALGDSQVSCVASATMDLQQWSENQSMRSAFNCDPLQQRESTLEVSVDMCSDDEDLETRPIDEKRKRRMLSNRASAQRSRQRRQERLDQLEVLTAQLRVENSTLHKKVSVAIQVAKKFEDHNTNLLKKVDKLAKELDTEKPKKVVASAFDECASSQQTTSASSCEMGGDRTSVDPNLMRDGHVNDGASSPSMSAGSPGCPSGPCPNENDMNVAISNVDDDYNNSNKAELSPVRRSFSACRVDKKRSFAESGIAGGASFWGSRSASTGTRKGLVFSQSNRPRTAPTGGDTNGFPESSPAFSNSYGLDSTLEADRWLEFTECFKYG